MGYKFLLPHKASTTRPRTEARQVGGSVQLNNLIIRSFHSTTILLVGALLQGLLVFVVPRIWILLPSALILLARFADTLAITFKFRPNPYLEDAILKKWSTVIPDTDGNFSDQPADEKIAILLLCAKFNHPLGYFSPHGKTFGELGGRMMKQLDEQGQDFGFLGQTEFNSVDARGANQLLLLSYWRSAEDILKYSQSPLHKDAWIWWDKEVHKDASSIQHIGISHEIFEAPRNRWESVSMNFQPTRLGATTYLKKGDKMMGGTVDDQWISPIVEAKGRMRTSRQRFNWADNVGSRSGSESENEKY